MFTLPQYWRSVRRVTWVVTQVVRSFSCDSGIHKSSGILAEYHRLIQTGKLQPDGTQLAAVQALQLLQDSLAIIAADAAARAAAAETAGAQGQTCGHDEATAAAATAPQGAAVRGTRADSDTAAAAGAPGAIAAAVPQKPRVQGAYLWGPVGSGKTMLMDMFLNTLPQITVPASGNGSPECSSRQHSSSNSCSERGAAEQLPLHAHRVHYHEFMLSIHKQLHQMQLSLPRIVTHSRAGLPVYRYALPPEDPLAVIARRAAAGVHLLCLDELHVTDIADAMLLSRLFGELLRQGCMVMFTSNRPARDLYKGGLSRKYFEPFIKLIDDCLLQLKVAGGKDYRLHLAQQAVKQHSDPHQSQQQFQQGNEQGSVAAVAAAGSGVWYVGQQAEQQLQQHWQRLQQQCSKPCTAAGADGQKYKTSPVTIPLPFGRDLWIPKAQVPVKSLNHNSSSLEQQQHIFAAYFTFEQICGNTGCRQSFEHAGALSATDHLAVVRACPVILIEGLPQLVPQQRDEARRLVTLVDILYEAHTTKPGSVQLIVSGAVAPDEVFLPLLGAAAAQGVNPNLGKSEGKLNVQQLVQDYGFKRSTPDELAAAAGEFGRHSGPPVRAAARAAAASAPELLSSLLPEEVLMYHRASSRLTELCAVVQT